MRWRVLQFSVFLATILANAHWQWTPNSALACGVGIGLAWFATAVVSEILDRGLFAGLAEALKVPGRIISALFVAMFIAPFQALKRRASSEDQIAPRLPLPQQTEAGPTSLS
jgi:hypothetical protein